MPRERNINLNIEQRESLSRGETVFVEVNGLQCVIVRQDAFERIINIADDDWTPEEIRLLALAALADADDAAPSP